MKQKAKIGITPVYDDYLGIFKISPFYAQAVEASGGLPFIIPYTRDPDAVESIIENLDGILFSGGDNVDPSKYGKETASNCGKIEYERDVFELCLCKKAEEKNKSVLGICRGCQLIAVAAGGTLFQHVDGHIQSTDKHVCSHTVKITRGSLLHSIFNADTTDVNSFHHQAVENTGRLSVAAEAENGSIEAVYLSGKKFHLGVQWHPERMYTTNIHAKMLFDSFISSCSEAL